MGTFPWKGVTVNIFDVASLAGVSKTTVSRVLTDSDKVSPETRQRVIDAIATLGYTPNTAARALAGGNNKIIGVINDITINDPFYGYVDDLLARECRKKGYGIVYTVVPTEEQGCNKEIGLLYGKVDGIVFTGNTSKAYEADIKRLIDRQVVPVAMVKTDLSLSGALSVDVENSYGGEQAANYLLAAGYSKIAYVHGNFHEGKVRENGFNKAMTEKGVSVFRHYEGYRSYRTAYQLASQILNESDRPDAVFCETDLMAYGLIQGIHDLGYSVPADIAVLGFDNVKFVNYEASIDLTTISQPLEQMARYVVDSLISKIENKTLFEEKSVLFKTEVKQGNTV